MGEARCHTEPLVVIVGAPVFVLAELLRAPPVREYMRRARWLHTADFAAVLAAVNEAANTWHDQGTRDNAVRYEPDLPVGDILVTVDEASELLDGLGKRQVQALAQRKRIVGRKVGKRWQLSKASVIAHRERKGRSL